MLTEQEILARSDCFTCGAEATYHKYKDGVYRVECVNIDCPISEPSFVTSKQVQLFATDKLD